MTAPAPVPTVATLFGELEAAVAGMSVRDRHLVTFAMLGHLLGSHGGDAYFADTWRAGITAALEQRRIALGDLTAVADAVHDPAVDELAQRRAGR